MTEWICYEISHLISEKILFIGDGYRAKNEELTKIGFPFARGGNINDGFHFEGADCFPFDSASRVMNKTSQPGDVVFTSKGTVGRFAFVRDDTMQFVYSPQLCFWRVLNRNIIDSRFLYFWMHGREFYEQFKGVSGQTDMAEYVSLTDQRRMHITLPEIVTQKRIASILTGLDDKIELNRRMNETLEAMARAIFKDWFVDFGPTRAKAEGRAPYLAADLWSLFPDRLDDDGKPMGWTIEPLLDHSKLLSGGTPKTENSEYWNGNVAWASAKDVSQCTDSFLIGTERSITERGLMESTTRLIPALATVVVARGATTGRFCMFGREMAMNQTCYALVSSDNRPFWLNCAFGAMVDLLVNAAHGSVFNTITTKTIEGGYVVQSNRALLDSFEATVTPLFKRMLSNIAESQTLAQTRDLLLPKLMSGDIRVRDAETLVENAL